jgi:N utilization substance protein A
MVAKLFELEVPEIASGAVEIKFIAREAGSRTKIAVAAKEEKVDPIGSCVGQKGTRVQAIINELGGEKIDIIEWSADSAKFIAHALAPAKVLNVAVDENNRMASVEVPEDQLSLAIGKRGQNVRLAAKLTGWKIDVVGGGKIIEKDLGEVMAAKEGKAAEPAEQAAAEKVSEEKKEKEPVGEGKKVKEKKPKKNKKNS